MWFPVHLLPVYFSLSSIFKHLNEKANQTYWSKCFPLPSISPAITGWALSTGFGKQLGRMAEGEAVRHVFFCDLSARYFPFQNAEYKPANCIVTFCTVNSSWENVLSWIMRWQRNICILATFFYLPTDAHVNCLLKNFKIYIKIYIKTAPKCFGAVTPSSGSALLVLSKYIGVWWCGCSHITTHRCI